jgi:hypothetical protein
LGVVEVFIYVNKIRHFRLHHSGLLGECMGYLGLSRRKMGDRYLDIGENDAPPKTPG